MDASDEATPTVEQRPFSSSSQHHQSSGQSSPTKEETIRVNVDYSSRSSSTSPQSASSSPSSSSSSSSSPSGDAIQGGARRKTSSGRNRRIRRTSGVAPSDLSNSYHEIFDTQMPPERATAIMSLDGQQDIETDGVSRNLEELCREVGLLPCDTTASDTTKYLTCKLVQDSLQWQNEHSSQQQISPISAAGSPNRKVAVSSLDPSLVLDLESDARHLATSVDNLVESLSGVLQGISALTVSTVETYRDGVCKTCDEVDGNIKGMYQLMAKVEELNKSMAPAYRLGEQLKEIKRLLDMYESTASGAKTS